jgi:hypothetical protein
MSSCEVLPALVAAMLTAVLGCGRTPYRLAPVSGLVTLDGKPLPNARVGFEPQSAGGGSISGPGSYGTTELQGRYELKTVSGARGAVVGRHIVRIATLSVKRDRSRGPESISVQEEEKVLDRYREPGVLTFTVPPAGTAAADFHLTSK